MAYLKRQIGRATGRILDSPTFTTPALGTPASGVMTNMTGAVEASFVDDAVTLAKMVSGTDGQIITYDASGNPVAVGPGSDGEVLTSTGAGSPPAFEASAGGVDNGPIFRATYDSDVASIGATNDGYINYANLEEIDIDGDYVGGTTMKFTPSTAGYYYIQGMCTLDNIVDGGNIGVSLYFNTTQKAFSTMRVGSASGEKSNGAAYVLEFNGSTDYAQAKVHTYFAGQATRVILEGEGSIFQGFRLTGT